MILALIDSRFRAGTKDARQVHKLDLTPTGILAAWAIVLTDEVSADDAESYMEIARIPDENPDENPNNPGLSEICEICEACEVFNDYWAEYGWYLNTYDNDWTLPSDCNWANPT